MEEAKKEANEKAEASASANSASKFGLTANGTVAMDGENDFCLQYFRAMECWKRPAQGIGHSSVSLTWQLPHQITEWFLVIIIWFIQIV